jgi:hypothetical protein
MTEETNVPATIRKALDAGAEVSVKRPGEDWHRVAECDGTNERFTLRIHGTMHDGWFCTETDICRITWK